MDLTKIEAATWCKTGNISTLELNHKYPISSAKRIRTTFGPTVLMTIRLPVRQLIFLAKRYSAVKSDDDIEKINMNTVSMQFL